MRPSAFSAVVFAWGGEAHRSRACPHTGPHPPYVVGEFLSTVERHGPERTTYQRRDLGLPDHLGCLHPRAAIDDGHVIRQGYRDDAFLRRVCERADLPRPSESPMRKPAFAGPSEMSCETPALTPSYSSELRPSTCESALPLRQDGASCLPLPVPSDTGLPPACVRPFVPDLPEDAEGRPRGGHEPHPFLSAYPNQSVQGCTFLLPQRWLRLPVSLPLEVPRVRRASA
jgi:hypothetical protein